MAENPHPIYSGEQYRVVPAPQSRVPSSVSPAAQQAAEGAQQVHENLSELESEGIERAEYTLDLQRQQYTAATQAEIDSDLNFRFTLPDGHGASFYNEKGEFRKDFYAEYIANVKSRFDNLHQGYIRPESQLRAAEASEKIKAQLVKGIDAKLSINLAPRARAAATKLVDYQLEMGDFVGARGTILGTPDYAMSDNDKQMAISRIDRASIMRNIENAAISGDSEAYLAIVSDDNIMKKLSPDERRRALAMQKSLSFQQLPATPGEEKKSTDGSRKSTDKAAKPQSPAHMGLPQGVPDALVKLYDRWNLHSDKDAMKSEEMQREARKSLDSFAASLVVPDMPTEDILHFRSVASCFGISSDEANSILDKYQRALKPTKGFDLTKQLAHAKAQLFTPRELLIRVNKHRASLSSYVSSTIGVGADEERINTLQAAIKLEEARIADFNDTLENNCRTKYAEWLSSQGDGKHLSDADRTVALLNIMDAEKEALQRNFSLVTLDDDDIENSIDFRLAVTEQAQLKEASTQAYERRKALSKDITATNTRRLAAAAEEEREAPLPDQPQPMAKSLPQFAQTSVSFSGARALLNTYSKPFLAVPKDDQLAGKSIAVKVKGHTYHFDCIPTERLKSPTFSLAAQASMGLLGSKTVYSLAYDAEGRAALVSDSPKPEDFDMYQALMGFEARRDSAGRIAVYTLPSGDGGGDYEVAGINQKYHPQEAAKLKDMVESGASNEDIENEIMAYYKSFTQQGVDLINSSTQSKGIELFMRDSTLNHGLNGTINVLSRALGISEKSAITPAVTNFIYTYGEQHLLEELIKARADYYADIVKNNPAKRKFAQGWANRLKSISRASFALLKQRSNDHE